VKTKMKSILLMIVLAVGIGGCGKTHMQRWYQASVTFTGTVKTMTAMGEMGYLSKETAKDLLPIIKEGDNALTELAEVAVTCDKYPELCDESRSKWLWDEIDNILAVLERFALDRIAKEEGGESKWQQVLKLLRL